MKERERGRETVKEEGQGETLYDINSVASIFSGLLKLIFTSKKIWE